MSAASMPLVSVYKTQWDGWAVAGWQSTLDWEGASTSEQFHDAASSLTKAKKAAQAMVDYFDAGPIVRWVREGECAYVGHGAPPDDHPDTASSGPSTPGGQS